MDLRARIQGCLLAGAAGDALGAAIEFLSIDEIEDKFGPRGLTDFVPAHGRTGAITDDTQMTLFTVEGLTRALRRGAELGGMVDARVDVHKAYMRWLATQGLKSPLPEDGPDGWLVREPRLRARRAPGNTCLSALARARCFGSIADNDSKGCGGVMRSAPFGFLSAAPDAIFRLAADCARTTHGHPTARVASGALALIIHFIAGGQPRHDAIARTCAFLDDLPDPKGETLGALEAARALARRPDWKERLKTLGEGWIAEEALALAVACALAADDLWSALCAAANHSGDSDSAAAICGNILGAELGIDALPSAWAQTIELADVILRLGADFALAIENAERMRGAPQGAARKAQHSKPVVSSLDNRATVRSEQAPAEHRLSSIVRGQRLGDLIGGPSTLASLLLGSVHSLRGFDARDVLRRYVEWWVRDGFDTGPVAEAVFSRIAGGADVAEAVQDVHRLMNGKTAGCGPVHRNIVLASAPFIDDARLEECVRTEARLTHLHELAAEACVAAARVCRRLARGEPWEATLSASGAGLPEEIASALRSWARAPAERSGYVPAVLHAALHFVGTARSVEDALTRSARFSGSANYVPVLAGAIAGARWGIAAQ